MNTYKISGETPYQCREIARLRDKLLVAIAGLNEELRRLRDRDRRFAALREMGCIVCLNKWGVHTHPEIHHLRAGAGAGMRSGDASTIPLCHAHHRTGGHGVAFHSGRDAFEAAFGSESSLLAQVETRLSGAETDAGDLSLPDSEGP